MENVSFEVRTADETPLNPETRKCERVVDERLASRARDIVTA
jgi:hypothetical protein